ncbi:MAG: glycosyltransferase family 4 protein [Patescibacteria group bacterium]|nr:glycosyltransferase family 4 protein [Patescibacteria group bacterium]
MKIIHLSCVSYPDIGGIGRVADLEVDLLRKRGVDAHSVSLTTHAGFRFGNAGAIHALEHFVRDADAVHLHYPFYGTQRSVARLKEKGVIKKLVITLHMDATAPGIKGLFFKLHRKFFQSRVLKAADILLVSSKDYASHSSFAPYFDLAVELPFGVDEQVFHPISRLPATSYQPPVILFVGGMDKAHAFKGVDVLLRAFKSVPNSKLILIGDGELRSLYEKQAALLGISERCDFRGKAEHIELIRAYQCADLLVLPSISGAEAFGLVALEAQACAVPVVASNLPGVRTVVADQETGILVPPKDEQALAQALILLCSNRELRQSMGECARKRVLEKFTWSKHMEKLTELYQQNVIPREVGATRDLPLEISAESM